MYAKTEIFYLMKDKVIPSLLNSEKNIKLEDIKEVFEKSSYWKNRNFKYMKNKNYSSKNKKNKITLKNKPDQFSPNKNINIIDILKINNFPKNSRNHHDNSLFKLGSKYFYNISSQRASVTFCNPLLQTFSNQIYKLTQPTNDNSSHMKTERNIINTKNIKNKKNKATSVNKNNNKKIYLIHHNNNFLKNKTPNFEYKTFYYFEKNKIKKLKFGDTQMKNDEEYNHLLLRGLALNNNQKKIYAKCHFINLLNDNENKKKIDKKKDKVLKTKEFNEFNDVNKKINNHKIITPNDLNLDINVYYSLKGLLNFKYPINININNKSN
jgi:hypothetical protein